MIKKTNGPKQVQWILLNKNIGYWGQPHNGTNFDKNRFKCMYLPNPFRHHTMRDKVNFLYDLELYVILFLVLPRTFQHPLVL